MSVEGIDDLTADMPLLPWQELPEDVQEHWNHAIVYLPLPPLPFEHGNPATDSARLGPREITAQISSDLMLAGKVLAVANAGGIQHFQPITSLDRAIVQLGMNQVRIMMTAYYLESLVGSGQSYPRAHFNFIRRCGACSSLLASRAAKRMKLSHINMLGTAALLSRLGALLMVLDNTPAEEYRRQPHEVARLEYEVARWQICSPVLSGQLLRHWGIPEPLPALAERSWEPLYQELEIRTEERALCLIAAAVVLAASYIHSSRADPRLVLERSAYRCLRENMDRFRLSQAFEKVWGDRRVRRELAARAE